MALSAQMLEAREAQPLAGLDAEVLLAVAERVLAQALRAGADEAEVFVQEGRSLSLDLERSMVEGASVGGDFGMGIRVQKGGKPGFGYAAEPRLAKGAIASALQAASRSPREGWRFPDPQPAARLPRPDPRIALLTVADLADRAQVVLDAARSVHGKVDVSGGGLGAGTEVWALANSRGLRHSEAASSVGASCSALLKDATISTGHDHESSHVDALDLETIGRNAARLAVDSHKPKPVASGTYDLLLKPEAMQELLEFCCLRGLLGENLRRKESPYVGLQGKQVAAKEFSLHDDGLLPGGLGTSARDDEGLPSRRTTLIDRGVLTGVMHDLRSAARDGAVATGCAQRSDRGEGDRNFQAPPRAAGRNFVVDGPRQPLDQLIAETRKGLLIHDVIGAHTANPVTGEFHVNSALLFKVEKGEIAGPAKSVMISGSMTPWLKALTGLSAEHSDVGGYSTPASLRLPWMRVAGVTVHA